MGIKAFFEKLFGKKENGNADQDRFYRQGNGGGNGAGKLEGTNLTCVECKNTFLFETGEQKFYKMRGLTPPKRCTNCRNKRRRHHRR